LFKGVKIEVHGRHEPEGGRVGLKSSEQVCGDYGSGDAVEIDEDVDRTNDAEHNPAMRIKGF
jgi:hypothetical protein